MDDLKFRRQAYAEPGCTDPEFLQAAHSSKSNRQLLDDLQDLDSKINKALQVDVPENLNEKIIFQQTHNVTRLRNRKSRVHLALAASVAFLVGLSVSQLWPEQQAHGVQVVQLGEEALHHVVSEAAFANRIDEQASLTMVNAKFKSFHGAFDAMPIDVTYVNHCSFAGRPALHMVVRGEMGPVTVFVVPRADNLEFTPEFSNEQFKGMASQLKQADLVVVGEPEEDIDSIRQMLKDNISWQAI